MRKIRGEKRRSKQKNYGREECEGALAKGYLMTFYQLQKLTSYETQECGRKT
jgi:hypothetical protein